MSELALKLIAENKKTRSSFLDLGNCGLINIPEKLAELVWLEELSFASERRNFIGGKWIRRRTENSQYANKISSLNTKEAVFSKLKNLKKLFLNGDYGHKFQFEDLSPLDNLLELQLLNLSRTQVNDLSSLKNLRALQQLDAAYSQINDLSPLENIRTLQQLYLSHTQVSDLRPLANLTALQRLNVYNTKVSDLSPLTNLSSLQLFYVHSSQVNDISPLKNLSGLQRLDLSNTQVSDLSSLTNLSGLQRLALSNTQVSDLSAITHLSSLQHLYVQGTQICDLSPLANLSRLQLLNIHSTNVRDLGPLTNLRTLQRLNLHSTYVSELGPLRNLKALQRLNVSRTSVNDLDPLMNLKTLSQLNVSRTMVSNLGPLKNLSALQRLDVSSTEVSDLNPLLKQIKSGLEVKWSHHNWEGDSFYVQDCPLTNPPAEIVKQGNAAILNYFSEQQSQGIDYLYEAKLLIIGEGGAGKTSLMRRLYQTGKSLPNEKEGTKGIDIHRFEFKLQNGRDFRLNVWDFGGQEIYHATHQFFLTKRSLYLLLDDTRNNYKSVHDHGFKYWLEVVDLLGDNSPLLIFQNEKNGRSKRIDKRGIKSKFTNVKEFYKGNLEVSHAADKTREAIQYFVQQLPHIGEAIPAKWVVIRADIEVLSKQRPYISLQTYFDIYSKHLEFDREKALFLSSYLHDLGVFLHFQDDALLTRTVILQNQWATEAVFKILDDEQVKANKGHFDTNDCKRLWQDSEYADMHPELLMLMKKFELCYQLSDHSYNNWLAPQLLPPSKPETLVNWAQPGDLVLRYRYKFLPKGIISRLIVRMYKFVQQTHLCWSDGVLFESDEAKLFAEISQSGNEILLRARGIEAKALISIISTDLDALNESFHRLAEKVEKLVPCHCSRCVELVDTEFFEQKRLLKRKKDGKLMLECPISYEEVHVLTLLDGISNEQLTEWAIDQATEQTTIELTEPAQRTIKIFLASSAELKGERDQFDLYFRQQNDKLRKKGIYLKVIRWENFLDAISETCLQDEYNKEVNQCDIFVSLFFTKTGKYTEEEFDTAHQKFQDTGKPLIYTFFKNDDIKLGQENRQDLQSLWSFQDKLKKYGHFYTQYSDIEHLKRQFKDQLDKLMDNGIV